VDDFIALVERYARALCTAPAGRPADVGAALGVDLAAARRLGPQLHCPPPPGAAALVLVVGATTGDVSTVELRPAAPLPLDAVTRRLGPARIAPPGPHGTVPTMIFDDVAPATAARTCAVLARPGPGWPGRRLVGAVTLYPRRRF
jgi:hypothetical protein